MGIKARVCEAAVGAPPRDAVEDELSMRGFRYRTREALGRLLGVGLTAATLWLLAVALTCLATCLLVVSVYGAEPPQAATTGALYGNG